VTFGGLTRRALMRGFSGGRCVGPLDLTDLTVEIILTFRIPRSLGPINSGPNSVETLCFFLCELSDSRAFSRPLL